MLRKLAVLLLLVPLPFNGLWMVCQDAPAATDGSAYLADESLNLFELAESVMTDESSGALAQGAECKRECPLKFASTKGSLCILSADGSGSIMISLFGVPILPPPAVERPVVTVAKAAAEPNGIYFSPTIAVHSPPPKA